MSDQRGGRGRGGGRGGRGGGDRGGRGGGDRGGRGGYAGGGYAGGDRGGRGGYAGGGYAGGDRGGRGGYAGGGYAGGDRGGRGAYGGGGGGGGRGSYDGGRGGGRGGFPGEGGGLRGGRGGGGGGYQGGRGRGRGGGGGGGGANVPMIYRLGEPVPPPDQNVTTLENNWLKSAAVTAPMSKLSLKDSATSGYPTRPAFGTKGTPITLWANYFGLYLKAPALVQYHIKVEYKPSTEDLAEKPQPEAPSQAPAGKPANKTPREAKGRRLHIIISKALEQLGSGIPVASDFKAQIVSLKRLPQTAVEVQLDEAGRGRPETWLVTLTDPIDMDISGLMNYIRNPIDEPGGGTFAFPRFPQEIIVLGIILGHSARANPDTAAVGSSRFFGIDEQRLERAEWMPDRSLLSILRGYFQSVRPATGRLLLNANVTYTVVRKVATIEALLAEAGLMNVTGTEKHMVAAREKVLKRMSKFLARSRICYSMPSPSGGPPVKTFRSVAGLAHNKDGFGEQEGQRPRFTATYAGPHDVSFFIRAPKSGTATAIPGLAYNSWVTVAEYYKARYRVKARPELPLINIGSASKPVYVLAERCEVAPGQPIKAKLSPAEQDAMINYACRQPPQNAASLTNQGRRVLQLDNNPLLQSFGIQVSAQLLTVPSRELDPPPVTYRAKNGNNNENMRTCDASWNMRNVKVLKAGRNIATWTYVAVGTDQRQPVPSEIREGLLNFVRFLASMGIAISSAPTAIRPAGATHLRISDGDAEFRKAFTSASAGKPGMVFVTLGQKDTQVYARIKRICDVELGIPTVCCVESKLIAKGNPGYYANVGLKVNLKAGGVNHAVQGGMAMQQLIASGKTMVVGYDVTHPTQLGGGGSNAPSLVGLVASLDSDLAQWPALAWENPPGQEVVVSKDEKAGSSKLKEAIKSRLQLWRQKNKNQLPENILIYRDGVSEGQFNMVLADELPHIREGATALYGPQKQPRITVIVSVKRHQTRFYPSDVGHTDPKSKSPKSGTVVDRGVTTVRFWDFFLQAHASLQGTARPAHYTVLLDEIFRVKYNDQAADALEQLTHEMCYLYGRATKAVSICPPAYYADLVCTRARAHRQELFDADSDEASSVTGGGGHQSRVVHPALVNTMYYV